jgi:ubiquinone/menaquinone biosynthesis C-methylase UbiE
MSAAAYVMGHGDRERRRLELQGAILRPLTEQLLVRSGIGRGMSVLDLGCGVGDVALIAAGLVGRRGRVTAIDVDEDALATAGKRAQEAGLANISFLRASIDEHSPERPVDAVVGRHILIHAGDPLAVLQQARRWIRNGGIVAFQEFDFSRFLPCFPPCPLRDRACAVFTDFFGRAGRADIGTRLYHLFVEAGFAAPEGRAESPIAGGPDTPYYEWLAESVRGILPRAQAVGIGLEFVDNVDSLAERLRDEAVTRGASLPGPLIVGAYGRKS